MSSLKKMETNGNRRKEVRNRKLQKKEPPSRLLLGLSLLSFACGIIALTTALLLKI